MQRREHIPALILQAVMLLSDVPDIEAESARTSHGWSAKEVLGHLIDSAGNNLHRIVRLMIHPVIEFPDYQTDNEAWVRVQRYQAQHWKELLKLWQDLNLHLAHVIARVPPQAENHIWKQSQEDISLSELIGDYVTHMEYHLDQLASLLNIRRA